MDTILAHAGCEKLLDLTVNGFLFLMQTAPSGMTGPIGPERIYPILFYAAKLGEMGRRP